MAVVPLGIAPAAADEFADLAVTAVSDPPQLRQQGEIFTVSAVVANVADVAAGPSTTRYYLSRDQTPLGGDRQLNGASSVPSFGPNQTRTVTRQVTVPTNMGYGDFFIVACVTIDDLQIGDPDGTNNCAASATTVQIVQSTRPDLKAYAAMPTPPDGRPLVIGERFTVQATTGNSRNFPAGASVTRIYLSTDQFRDGADRLLPGRLKVLAFDKRGDQHGTTTTGIPRDVAPGAYYLISCADDLFQVLELQENNNCQPATGPTIQVVGG